MLADCFLRYRPNTKEKEIVLEQTICSIQWSQQKLIQLRSETKRDPTLSSLPEVILFLWPKICSELPTTLKPSWSLRDYMSIDDGIVLKGQQIVVPPALQYDDLSELRGISRQGIEKTRLLAKSVYIGQT